VFFRNHCNGLFTYRVRTVETVGRVPVGYGHSGASTFMRFPCTVPQKD
jgi:hypothetical protein